MKLLKGLRVLGVPVYLTQQYTKGLGDTVAPIRKPADHRMALERAKQEGILLTTCEATLFELLAAAGTPDSKAIQKLIK